MSGKIPIIGRLHRVEAPPNQKGKQSCDFDQMKPGDRIEAKILRKVDIKGRTMIELTRRPEHLNADKLD